MLQLCIVYRFVLVLLLSVLTMAEERVPFCPPGFVRNETGSCVCWKYHLQGILQCDEETGVAKIANGYCMTFGDRVNRTIVGKCPFQNISSFKHNAGWYILLFLIASMIWRLSSVGGITGGVHCAINVRSITVPP